MNVIQKYQEDDVVTAARRRIGFLFDNFDDIKVSISGGKDSTVLAHLCAVEAHRRGQKIGLFFLDEEVVYQSTIDQITWMIEEMLPEAIIPLWLQLPFNLTNSVSLTESQLIAWEPGKSELWMRPKKSYAIKAPQWNRESETVADKNKGFGFYDVFRNFESCYSNAASLVGIRATESPNRWRSVAKHPVEINGTEIYWGTPKGDNYAFYPIYDWNFSDVWKYIHQQKLRYSSIYDLQFKKGFSINEFRVSSLIHEKSFKSLVELPEFEPKTFNRLSKRIKGIEFAAETGRDSKMFQVRKLPKQYANWIEYRDFLLNTYPDAQKKPIFGKRFSRQKNNNFVARQQCRQLILNDYENNLPIKDQDDPRDDLLEYYRSVL